MLKKSALTGQVVLITGASSGIGAALAEVLASNHPGICLVLVSRDKTRLEEIAERCRQNRAEATVVPADLAHQEQVESLAQRAIACYGRIDILVNNAGYGQMGPVELIPPAAAKKQFAVNFHAPLMLSQAVIPKMRSRGGGKIVNVSSLGGRIPFPTAGMYSSSKFALEALSDVMRMELKAFKIQVSIIEPGPIVTDFFDAAWQQAIENIPDYQQSPYAPVFQNIKNIDKQLGLLGWSAEKTAKAIARIIAKPHLKPRYVLATGGNTMLFIMNKILPTQMRDEFWKRLYGIHKLKNTDTD